MVTNEKSTLASALEVALDFTIQNCVDENEKGTSHLTRSIDCRLNVFLGDQVEIFSSIVF